MIDAEDVSNSRSRVENKRTSLAGCTVVAHIVSRALIAFAASALTVFRYMFIVAVTLA